MYPVEPAKPLWGEFRKPRSNRTGQDKGPAGVGRGNKKGVVCKAQGIPGVKLFGCVLGFAPFLPFNEGINSFLDEVQV